MTIKLSAKDLSKAGAVGPDAFLDLLLRSMKQASRQEELCAEAMRELSPDQITLWAYLLLRREVMSSGFVGLIHNGYGPFFFQNPFAKAMRLWGLHDFAKLLYRARELYKLHQEAITRPCTDEEFMALYEQYPDFDELDDQFITDEEDNTYAVAHYVDEHLAELGFLSD